MEHGRRYENLAWRLWGRETFCCAPDHIFPHRWTCGRRLSDDCDVPELSSSVDSELSKSEPVFNATAASRSNSSTSRPHLKRQDSTRGKEKHMRPVDLVKVVNSIQEKKTLQPLSPLPEHLSHQPAVQQGPAVADTTPRPSSPPPARFVPESSSSTVATALGSEGMSPTVASDVTASTELSSHSVVIGFVPGQVASFRSSTSLVPQSVMKSVDQSKPEPTRIEPSKKKAPIQFTLGASSDEDGQSSFEASMTKRSSLTLGMKKLAPRPSFPHISKPALKPTSEESAIEDTDSESDSSDDGGAIASDSEEDEDGWEDENDSNPSSLNEREMFQRVDSRAHLTSHRSLLTDLMNEGDRAQAMLQAATRSTPALRRSRTSTPNGPSTGNSPQEDSPLVMRAQVPRSKPIIMTTSNVHPPTLSPRTTRRNMLQTELTESLRKNLLWERQQKNATTNAVTKRQSAVSIPALRRAATTNDIKGLHSGARDGMAKVAGYPPINKNTQSVNEYFDQGLQEYHQKGW